MREPLISVIMSAYNETEEDLKKSVSSVLFQTYRNIEFIVIDDNPDSEEVQETLLAFKDSRMHIFFNEQNIGLVSSLNKALTLATGEYVARMDADDIALPDRLQKQINEMLSRELDMLGCDIQLIDEQDQVIQERMHFPVDEKRIRRFAPWGNCLMHPTWMVRREVYQAMNGYRQAPYCEDYDFLLRVLAIGKYRVDNIPIIGLKYRVRKKSISRSHTLDQYVLSQYLSKNHKSILSVTQEDIEAYTASQNYMRDREQYESFLENKAQLKHHNNPSALIKLFLNRYSYRYAIEKLFLLWREKI